MADLSVIPYMNLSFKELNIFFPDPLWAWLFLDPAMVEASYKQEAGCPFKYFLSASQLRIPQPHCDDIQI